MYYRQKRTNLLLKVSAYEALFSMYKEVCLALGPVSEEYFLALSRKSIFGPRLKRNEFGYHLETWSHLTP